MDDLKANFIDYAIKYGEAIAQGDHKTANKLHTRLRSTWKSMEMNGHADALLEISAHPNEPVQLWAATYLLKYHTEIALKMLGTLRKSPKITGLEASTVIDMWNKGMLDL
jgi:hypothetical protein